jgi:hypothetical protein
MVELNPKSENRVNYPTLKLFCEEIWMYDVINNIQNRMYKAWLTLNNKYWSWLTKV